MKKSTCFLLSLSSLLCCASLAYAEVNTVHLQLPENFSSTACPSKPWAQTKVIFQGVKDERGEKQVGEQQQKKAEPLGIFTEPSLEKIFSNALQSTFASCGMVWTKASEDIDYPSLSVSIEDFFVGSNKKWLTGKASAHAQITVTLIQDKRTSSTTITADIDSKKLRQESIKQLQRVLNDLFAQSVTQVLNIQALQELK